MRKTIRIAAFAVGIAFGLPAAAQSPADVFANCMIDTLNGKQRKNLAKWIFLSMSAHPEIKPYANASASDIDQSDRYIGRLITRLLTVDCPNELRAAAKSDPQAVEKAFQLVGKIAMQELTTNQATMRALTNYIRYADQAKIKRILNE